MRFGSPRPPPFSDHDPVHPNRHGARLIARLLLDELDGLGWLN